MFAYLFGFVVVIVPLGLFYLRVAEWFEQGSRRTPNRDIPPTVMDRASGQGGASSAPFV